jgi:Cdc6-like AAA superfamily ATPase
MIVPFEHPFTALVSGPTGSGKTVLVKNILLAKDKMINDAPKRVFWYYSNVQPVLNAQLPFVHFLQGLPNTEDFKGEPAIVVVDDMMEDAKHMVSMFVRESHHRGLSIFFLVQNLFEKNLRTISINSHYIICFKNPRERQQIQTFARQLARNPKYVHEAYDDATSQPYGYLLFDFRQTTPENLRVRTSILPDETTLVYTDKRARISPSYH